MPNLSEDETRQLRQMADDLVASVQDRTYWLSTIRDTSVAILDQLTQRIGDPCGRHPPDPHPSTAHPCVRPAHHPGHHLNTRGQSWPDPPPT